MNAINVPSGKTRPIKVEFCNIRDKVSVLNTFTNINRILLARYVPEFKDVMCFPDRTYIQRENFKALKLDMEVKNHQWEVQGVLGERYEIKFITLTKN